MFHVEHLIGIIPNKCFTWNIDTFHVEHIRETLNRNSS